MGLPVGRPPDLDDPRMENYLPYLYRLLDGNCSQGLVLEVLVELSSIWKSSNKGFLWDSVDFDVFKITKDLTIMPQSEAYDQVPNFIQEKGYSAISSHLSQRGITSLMMLSEELNRRLNFLKWWRGAIPTKSLLRFKQKRIISRHREVWKSIRKKLIPMGRPFYIKTVGDIEKHFGAFTFGLFYKRDDAAISSNLGGMPSLFFKF
jgi:hypothetical protein